MARIVISQIADREKWTKDYDEFGDSWTKPATVQSIKSCLERTSVDRKAQQQGKDDLISELTGYRYFLFKGHRKVIPTLVVYIKRLLHIYIYSL